MTIEELIERLKRTNTGAQRQVLIQDAKGRYWTPTFESSRIGTTGEEPFEPNDDYGMSLIICPPAEADDD